MTLKRFMTMERIANGGLPEWAKMVIEQAYAEGKKEGKAQENRRLHRMHREWQKILDKFDGASW